MGGSAGGNSNAQIFQLLSQYGGDGATAPQKPPRDPRKSLQRELDRQVKAGAGIGNMHFNPYAFFSALDRSGSAGYKGGAGGGAATNTTTPGTTTPGGTASPPPAQMYWQFPQYTQSWAFTPPAPTPYEYPQPFDTSKYGNPLNPKNIKKNR